MTDGSFAFRVRVDHYLGPDRLASAAWDLLYEQGYAACGGGLADVPAFTRALHQLSAAAIVNAARETAFAYGDAAPNALDELAPGLAAQLIHAHIARAFPQLHHAP